MKQQKRKQNSNIAEFENDMHQAYKQGHIVAVNYLAERAGVEINLPHTICEHQAKSIATYISKRYALRACFFIKKHNINVYYEE